MITVIGGHGQVGAHAVAQLRAWGAGPLRVGGRTAPDRVDALDPAGLAAFCAGATTVLNCAGPAAVIGSRVARAAHAAGARYVDASGDDALHAELSRLAGPWTAVVSAGMMPGLSGLLPHVLLSGFPEAETLTGYVGGRDTITEVAAVDYLGADAYGEAMAAWRGDRRVPGALRTRQAVQVPFYPEPITAVPYLSTETERVARRHGLREVEWYSAYAGNRVLAALYGRPSADELRAAAELDAFGHERYQLLVLTASSDDESRSLVLRGTGASALTGTAAALATWAVEQGDVPPGVWHLAEIPHGPSQILDRLAGCAAVVACDLHVDAGVEEGVL
ncbi:hypothetical protein [Planotetraspora sp. GP83]|uniref:hypothetical protein n=1 Tax=Planotetraspora sp. GP83 TaxID=3156264 RepID=UPI0035184727